MGTLRRPLAVVTGASSGIGYELAKQFAQHGYDLVVCAANRASQARPRSCGGPRRSRSRSPRRCTTSLMAGKERVVAGNFSVKMQGVLARFMPEGIKAGMHEKMSEHGSAKS